MTATVIAGVVPHVTCGLSLSAATVISRSNVAPSSVCRSLQPGWTSTLRSRSHANVVSSGAIMPARPPPSIVMLQTVIRPSIVSASMAGPANSTTCPVAPATPIWPIVPRMRSFAVTPWPSAPS